ncbi:MAG TPA: MerR family transcriptional regulator [Polyangiaceae bacterium]|jgi:DNA-binding transcriptional MerR regulator|nr:MerR family transcriptional regulator [Polyangiaceae bacterium]
MKIHSGVESRTAPSNQNGSAEHRERPSENADSAARAKRTQETYTTGDMARLSNNTLRTVRFYEEAGILTPLGRTDGGHRVFERSELERLLLVTDMREAGFSLEQIRDLLEVKQRATSGGAAATQALKSLRGHIEDLRVKVEVLNRLAADLESTAQSASACLECKNPDLFPANCKSCARISDRENVPRGMRVLWSLSGLEPHADAAPAEAPPQDQATIAAKKARA